MTPPPTVAIPLLIVSALGGGFVAFGYRLVPYFLRWTGWIGGAAAGGAVGWQLLPQLVPSLTGSQQLGWTVALLVAGAIAGRIFLPVATRLAAIVAGFLSTAGAVGVFFLGDPIITRLTAANFETEPVETTAAVATDLEPVVVSQGPEVFGIVVAAGMTGAIVATRYHTELIAAGITLGGALLLGIALPLWQTALTGSATLGVDVTGASLTWTAVTLIAGVVIQFIDHRGDIDWPLVSSD